MLIRSDRKTNEPHYKGAGCRIGSERFSSKWHPHLADASWNGAWDPESGPASWRPSRRQRGKN